MDLKMKRKIKAEIVADSVNEHGNRITTYVLTYPRIIHAELLTHRLFSRNAASSRAIPVHKMIEDVENDPFIPVAWQKKHSGMQGTEYFTSEEDLKECISTWYEARNAALGSAEELLDIGTTKQLTNRLLEPFQWYTCLVTATEYDNFFELRCPQYTFESGYPDPHIYKSRKDFLRAVPLPDSAENYKDWTDLDWLKVNQGQGEIHISLLAEAMWDAKKESEPKQLKAGEWHIPFGDRFDTSKIDLKHDKGSWTFEEAKIKIATARCARISYSNFEGKDDYEADIKLYDTLLASGHMSPFEHCAKSMSDYEFWNDGRGIGVSDKNAGWSGNFRGFVQLRKTIE